jgi:chemotaxis protein MotB
MQPGTLAKAITVIVLMGTGAIGLYAYQQHRDADAQRRQNADTSVQLGDCTKTRDDEKKAREGFEKTAADTAVDLQSARAQLEDLKHQKEEADKRAELFKSLTDKFRKMIDSGKLQVVMRGGRMVVKLPAGVLFPSGSAELSKDGQAALTDVAHILKQFPDRRFEVAGHTDNVPVLSTSSFKNNLELSTARGVTVANYLTGAGMNASRLSAAGYAEWQPVASNAKESGRTENRRIEIVLLPNLSELAALGDAGAE